jgi:hypothetical protein
LFEPEMESGLNGECRQPGPRAGIQNSWKNTTRGNAQIRLNFTIKMCAQSSMGIFVY